MQRNLKLSPSTLPRQLGLIACQNQVFDGLFAVFNHSLLDGWGRLLLDRHLTRLAINPALLSPLDRLRFIGQHGMGTLTYEPVMENLAPASTYELDAIAKQIYQVQQSDQDEFVEDLLHLNSSSTGARPKVSLTIDDEAWLIKFPSMSDSQSIGRIEYAYNLMASAAGLERPAVKLFPADKQDVCFGSKRFDRTQNESTHMHTVSGLLHANHRLPSLDYESIIKATLHLTGSITECEKLFRLCAFNILSHNRDDHAKNFSFLMDSTGKWRVSPAYDLTFSSGPAGEHCTMIMGEGKQPGLNQLQQLAKVSGIKLQAANQIIDTVKSSTSQWSSYAEQAQLKRAGSNKIAAVLKKIVKNNF